MGSIIIAFPSGKKKTSARMTEILLRNGYREVREVTGGYEALREAGRLQEGILICPVSLGDMHFSELLDYLPAGFSLLLADAGNQVSAGRKEGVIAISMPVSIREFLDTVRMMMLSDARRKKREKKQEQTGGKRAAARDPREENYIRNAKSVLMERNHMTEPEAHRYLQKISMDTGRSLVESAQMILYMAVR